ncbi:MAG: fumarylacetoacetate hydrolase family protein, partial [Actinomycetota bacterium]|nr:fumarylacetoacetate hydrolase family protein [Actinomycetota bacterium]
MRIYRYASNKGGFMPRLAVAVGEGDPVDLLSAWDDVTGTRLDPESAQFLVSTSQLIESGPEVWSEVRDVARAAASLPDLLVTEGERNLRWLCPIDRVASLKDFLAFEDHVKRGAQRRHSEAPDYWYEAPVYYKGNHRAVIGPDAVCPWPSYTKRLDFELELALIVGRRGRDVPREEAAGCVFGFTVFNDFSARDVQAKEMSAWLGPAKGKDFANALGPCIVTADEVGAEPDLQMICRVNGEEWGRARSSEMHWRWAEIISHVSRSEDVHPGDVYGSGTPGGCCGLDLDRSVRPGDVVELEIEKIGVLRNVIGDPITPPA